MGLRTSRAAFTAVMGLVLTITGCTASGGDSTSSGIVDSPKSPGIKVGVIVSDPANSARWEQVDQPLLNDAMTAQGLQADIENSEGDATQFAAIADSMINDGVKVLVIAAPNNQIGTAVAGRAAARHIPTIGYDYDRLDFGDSADYSVSFDTVKVGELQGRGLTQDLRARSTHDATILEINGPQTDPTTPLLTQGARNVLQPRYDTGVNRLVASRPVGNDQDAGAVFEQLLNGNGGHVDGVLAANDGVASAVIAVLRKHGLNGQVRVTGMGATPQALRAILRGDQYMTVFKPIAQQITAVAKLAGALARNDRATANNMASTIVTDPIGHRAVRAILIPPVFITLDTVKQVIDSRMVDSHDICDSELTLRCDQLNIPR